LDEALPAAGGRGLAVFWAAATDRVVFAGGL